MNQVSKFNLARDLYNDFRRDEKMKLIAYLQQNDFKILRSDGREAQVKRSYGQGKTNYKGDYDLSNWQYVYAQNGGKWFYISLQCFDKGEHNYHVLMDRIGVCIYDADPEWNFSRAIDEMRNTGVDLPLDARKLERLLKILRNN